MQTPLSQAFGASMFDVQAHRPETACAVLLAREIERPSHRKRFCHARFRGAVTDHDIHLVRLPGEKDVRDSASPREALKARSMNGQ
jgi:hypothetical protein